MTVLKFYDQNQTEKNIYYNNQEHPYHIVRRSIWPILTALSLGVILIYIVLLIHKVALSSNRIFYFKSLSRFFIFSVISWFYDIHLEGSIEGQHTSAVRKNLLFGFSLFIISEVILFVSFFWRFLYSARNASIWVGDVWPPIGLKVFSASGLPLVNTILLLSSGRFVTRVHFILHHAKSLHTYQEEIRQFHGSWLDTDGNQVLDIELIFQNYNREEYVVEYILKNYSFADFDLEYYDEWSRQYYYFYNEEESESIRLELESYKEYYYNWQDKLNTLYETSILLYTDKNWFHLVQDWVKNLLLLIHYHEIIIVHLIGAIILGIIFTICQRYEYIVATFTRASSIYGTVFFRTTGLHGLHVIGGTLFLLIQLIRYVKGSISSENHIGLLCRIWYWHFVDIIWIRVYFIIYVWGNSGLTI